MQNKIMEDKGIDVMVILSILGMAFEIIGFPFKISILISFGVFLIRTGVIVGLLTVLIKDNFHVNINFMLLVIIIGMALLSFLASGEIHSLGFLFSFVELPIFIYSIRKISNSKVINYIYSVFILLSFFYIVLSFMPNAYLYYTEEWGYVPLSSMTLGYSNPNQTAMYVFSCFVVLLSAWFYYEKLIIKVILAINLIFLVWIIIATESRAILLALIGVVFFFFFKKIPANILRYFCFIIATGFVPISLIFEELLRNINLFGVRIETGRADIYSTVFENLDIMKFFLGDYGYLFKNMHNGFLSVFATIGIIATLSYIMYLNIYIRKIERNLMNSFNKIAWLGVVFLILHSAGEAAILTFGEVYAMSFCSLYTLSTINKNEVIERGGRE